MSIKNDRLLKVLQQQAVDRPPLWMMRQAGRYLPEYRASREQAGSFLTLCKTPELACEVTLQPLRRFGFDAAILFSDILTIPDAMGLGLSFNEGEGPRFAQPIRTLDAIDRLPSLDPEQDLTYVMDAVRLIKHELHDSVPLIGFAGSPWTLASYMIEGASSKDFILSKALMYAEPAAMQRLLAKLTQAVSDYLNAQIKAGADVVMLFDSWGGMLPTHAFKAFSLASMKAVIARLNPSVPVIVFTKGGGMWLEDIQATGCHAIGIDWQTDLQQARQRLGAHITLQGNLDPITLFTRPEVVRQHTLNMLHSQTGPYIANLGHGILPNTPIANVEALVDTVQQFRYGLS